MQKAEFLTHETTCASEMLEKTTCEFFFQKRPPTHVPGPCRRRSAWHHAAITIWRHLACRHHHASFYSLQIFILFTPNCLSGLLATVPRHLAGNEDGGRAHPAERSLRAGNGNGGRGLPALPGVPPLIGGFFL
jgi:hypothetical protein